MATIRLSVSLRHESRVTQEKVKRRCRVRICPQKSIPSLFHKHREEEGTVRTKKLTSPWVVLVAAIAAFLLAGCAKDAPADEKLRAAEEAQRGFSFAVYGDSRSMMYLPYRADQEAEARQLMVDMFELVLPVHVAEAVVKKDVKLTYDPATKELVQMVMPFDTASEVTTLTVDKGWVTEASVEDVKLMPGVRHTMFRLQVASHAMAAGVSDRLWEVADLVAAWKASERRVERAA
jgi:hypothetical protein